MASQGADVVLTDLEEVLYLPEMNSRRQNIEVKVKPLKWGESIDHLEAPYDIIVGCDVVYMK